MGSAGGANTASGSVVLHNNTTGADNTACGYGALFGATGGRNIAIGNLADAVPLSGNDNIHLGNTGGTSDESNTRRLGSAAQACTCIAGIFGQTASDGLPMSSTTRASWTS